jgi:prenyltransferase beta subunit
MVLRVTLAVTLSTPYCSSSDAAQALANQRQSETLTEAQVVARVTAAVDRAMEYIAAKQNPDGSWNSGNGRNNAINAVALLALMGRGHVPERGPYRDVLEKGRRFILSTAQPSGLFASPNASHGPMYEHALATLAMVEMYGMTADPEQEAKTRRAVELIVKTQSPNGGWRYQPHPGDADLSVTVMQIVALRAANNAEIPVPKQTIDKAIAYVKQCAVPSGGFAYQPGQGAGAARSAAGILSLQLCGNFNDPLVEKAIDYLSKQPLQWQTSDYFYYLHYYAIQGFFQFGGNAWNSWHPRIRELLLQRQNANGSWDVPPGCPESQWTGQDKIYSTAMASLILEIYMHYLPAYQR